MQAALLNGCLNNCLKVMTDLGLAPLNQNINRCFVFLGCNDNHETLSFFNYFYADLPWAIGVVGF
jgi:hypothetical protein